MADVNANIDINIDTSNALAQLKSLQRQISQFHTSIAKSSETAAIAQRNLQKNLLNSINAISGFSAELRTVKTSAESFTDSLEKNKFSMREYFRYAGASTKTFGRLFKSEFDTIGKVAEERVKRLQTQYIKLGRDTNGAMQAIAVMPTQLNMGDYGTQVQIAAQKQALFNQLMKQGSTNLLNFGKNTQWAGRQLMVGFSIPLMAVGTAATKTFMDMEAQALKFRKVYGDLFTPKAETQQALDNIMALGKSFTQYGIAVKDTVAMASEAAAAGFKGIDLQRQTEQATRLQVLGQIDAQKALETTISLQNAFAMSSEDLAGSIDFLNAVENQTVVSLDDITTAIPKVAPVIQQLGGDVKDLTFFMAAMKEGGINASEGANALKSGLAALINPTTKASAMLKGLGIDIKGIIESNKGDLKATVIGFAQALDTLAPLTRARAIEQLFGKFQFARLSTLFQNVTKDGSQAAKVLDLAGTSIENLANLSNQELGMTADSAMNKFKASVENLKLTLIPVGEAFLKAVTPIIDFVGKILDKFNDLSDGTKKVITLLTVGIGAAGPILLMTFGLLANGLANVMKLFLTLRNGYQRLTGQTKILGEQTQYMTAEQLDAAAAAHSLDQTHANLTQTFNAEADAINQLIAAYSSAALAAQKFAQANPGMMLPPRRKLASGGIVTGPGSGTSDSIPAMLSNGEAVIPADKTKRYAPLVRGMIAGNIPGFADGRLGFAGKEYNIPIRSQAAIDEVLSKFSRDVQGIDRVLQMLEKRSMELGEKFKLSGSALKTILDVEQVQRNNPKGTSSSGGYVFAHAMEPIEQISDSAKLMDLAMTENLGSLKKYLESAAKTAGGYARVMSNFGFILPEQANKGKMAPGAVAQEFQGANITRTMAPVFAEYARTLGMTLEQALADPTIKQQMNADIEQYAAAISNEISKVPDQFLNDPDFYAAVAQAEKGLTQTMSAILQKTISNMQSATTIATFGGAENRGTMGQRTAIPLGATGIREELGTAAGISSYRGRTSVYIKQGEQIGIAIGESAAQGIIQGAREVLRSQSPSEEMKQVGRDGGQGFILGGKEKIDDAKLVGQEIATAVVVGAGSGGGLVDKNGRPIRSTPSSVPLSTLSQSSAIGEQTKKVGDSNLNQMRVMDQRLSRINSALMGGTFALTSVAGAGSMAGGALGNISGQVMKYSGLLFGLMSVTQLLTQAKVAELVATRLASAKQAANFATYGTGMASRSGILGILGRVGIGLTRFLGPVGLVVTGLTAVAGIIKITNAAREKERQAIEGLGNAATLSKDQLKSLADFFNIAPQKLGYENMPTAGAKIALATNQRTKVDELKTSDFFNKQFGNSINSLRSATNTQAGIILRSLATELKGRGFAEDMINTIITALREESGKKNVQLNFKSIDIKTEEGKKQLEKDAQSLVNDIDKNINNFIKKGKAKYNADGTGTLIEYLVPGKALEKSLSTTSKSLKAMLGGIQGQFANGIISADQYKIGIAKISTVIEGMKEPGALLLINETLKQMGIDKDVLAAATNIDNLGIKLKLLEAAALGAIPALRLLELTTALTGANGADSKLAAMRDLNYFITQFTKEQQAVNKAAGTIEGSGDGTKSFGQNMAERIKAIKSNITALNAMRKAGIDAAIAQELAADPTLSAQIAKAAAGSKAGWNAALIQIREYVAKQKELNALIESMKTPEEKFLAGLEKQKALIDFQNALIDAQNAPTLKNYNDELAKQQGLLEGINKQIDAVTKNQVAPLEAQIKANNYALEEIAIKEDAINAKYNTQIAALEKISTINQDIANIQKQRLSIADALSRGDISAAAELVQQARAEQASSAITKQKDTLTAVRDQQLSALGRNELEAKNKDLQYQISQIQKNTLDSLDAEKTKIQESIDAQNTKITALETLITKQKDSNTEVSTQIDLINLAKAAGISFDGVIMNATTSAKSLTDQLYAAYMAMQGLSAGPSGSGTLGAGSSNASTTTAAQAAKLFGGMGSSTKSSSSPLSFGGSVSSGMTGEIAARLYGGYGSIANSLNTSSYNVPDALSFSTPIVANSTNDNSTSVYNYSVGVNVSGTNSNPNDIARAVMTQIKGFDAQRIRVQ